MPVNSKEYADEVRNTRILIDDLVNACRVLGEVKVVAAGSMFATLSLDLHDRQRLIKAGINWHFD